MRVCPAIPQGQERNMNATRGVKTGADRSLCSGSLTLRKSPATASQATPMPQHGPELALPRGRFKPRGQGASPWTSPSFGLDLAATGEIEERGGRAAVPREPAALRKPLTAQACFGPFLQMTHNQQNSKDSESSVRAVPLLGCHGNSPVPQERAQKEPGQTDTPHHTTAAAPPGAAAGNAEIGPAFGRADMAEQEDSQPPSCCTQAAVREYKPSPPPPAASGQTTRAAKKSHSCGPLLFPLCLCLLFSLSSTHRSLSSTATHPAPSSASFCSPFTSIHLAFGVLGP